MKEDIKTVFDALQDLDIKSTPHNVSILDGVFDILRKIYQEMGVENAPCVDGRDGN